MVGDIGYYQSTICFIVFGSIFSHTIWLNSDKITNVWDGLILWFFLLFDGVIIKTGEAFHIIWRRFLEFTKDGENIGEFNKSFINLTIVDCRRWSIRGWEKIVNNLVNPLPTHIDCRWWSVNYISTMHVIGNFVSTSSNYISNQKRTRCWNTGIIFPANV